MRKRAYGEPAHGCTRGVARLTQIELSRKSGVPQETISWIERGRANPTMSTLEKLARAEGAKINLTIGWLRSVVDVLQAHRQVAREREGPVTVKNQRVRVFGTFASFFAPPPKISLFTKKRPQARRALKG